MSEIKKGYAKGQFKVNHQYGLYSIPSAEIVKCASLFKSQVYLIYQKQSVSAKSLLSILTLTATKGACIKVEAEGEDAEEAVHSILELAHHNFHIVSRSTL